MRFAEIGQWVQKLLTGNAPWLALQSTHVSFFPFRNQAFFFFFKKKALSSIKQSEVRAQESGSLFHPCLLSWPLPPTISSIPLVFMNLFSPLQLARITTSINRYLNIDIFFPTSCRFAAKPSQHLSYCSPRGPSHGLCFANVLKLSLGTGLSLLGWADESGNHPLLSWGMPGSPK